MDGFAWAQPGDIVAVTGASGYVAGHVIRSLIKKGYTVRGTVRSLEDTAKVGHLQHEFPGIQLYQADLLKGGSFAECFDGCKFVVHTASPFRCGTSQSCSSASQIPSPEPQTPDPKPQTSTPNPQTSTPNLNNETCTGTTSRTRSSTSWTLPSRGRSTSCAPLGSRGG